MRESRVGGRVRERREEEEGALSDMDDEVVVE